MKPELTKEQIEEFGYQFPRQLPNGKWIAIQRFLFTWGLVLGLDQIGYEERWCYRNFNDALIAVANWDGNGDPPGNWIVNKPSQRQGPGSLSNATDEQKAAADEMAKLSREMDLN